MKNLLRILTLSILMAFSAMPIHAQTVEMGPLECFPQYTTAAEMDAAADGSAANPYATWQAVYGAVTAIGAANQIINIQTGDYSNITAEGNFDVWQLGAAGLSGLTIEGNNSTITVNGVAIGFLEVAAGVSNVTVQNVVFQGFNRTGGSVLALYGTQNFTCNNCVFDSNPTINPLEANGGATAIFNNCVFSNNPRTSLSPAATPNSGAGTITGDATFITFNDTDFLCNERNAFGGALDITDAEVNINGGTFSDNIGSGGSGDGGAINVEGSSTMNIDGTNFTCNLSEASTGAAGGGAIRIQSGPTVTITNSNFWNNSVTDITGSVAAGGYGGAINVSSTAANISTLTIDGCTFVNNHASRGGAIYVEEGSIVSINNTLIDANDAQGTAFSNGGGGIFLDNETITITNSTISNNWTLDDNGGGIEGGAVNLMNSTICNNTEDDAPGSGGDTQNQTGATSITDNGGNYIGADCTQGTNGATVTDPALACTPCPVYTPAQPECVVVCLPPDISIDPNFAEICPTGQNPPTDFDLATATITDASAANYPPGAVITTTYIDSDGLTPLGSSTVAPSSTTTYFIEVTNDNETPADDTDDCSDIVPFTVIVDNEAPTIMCPADFTIPVCDDIANYPPAADVMSLNDSLMRVCLGPVDITFGSDDGFFDISAADLVQGEGNSATADFDIIDEINGVVGPGGASDIFFTFETQATFDPYGGMVMPSTTATFDILQSTSGIRGTIPMGNSGAADATTGDVRCYAVTVTLAPHLKVEAQDFNALITSINTDGEAYESAAIQFLDINGNPFGTANYAGFYSDPVSGTMGNGTGVINNSTWNTSGLGVYTADDQSVIDVTTDPLNPVGTASTGTDNLDPNAATDGALAPTTPVGGVIYTVCLEEVAATAADGDVTTTSTTFTSTLNGFSLSDICVNSAVCDNNGLADLTLTSMDVPTPDPIIPTDGGTIIRTYTITDACGNEAACTQTITIPPCQACPDIIDGTLSASVNMASVMDVCSGDAVTVCVDVDVTNDPTATVEFSNDAGATWTVGVPDMAAVPVTTHTVNIVSATVPYDVSAGPYYVGDVVNYQASGTHPIEIIDPSGAMVVTGVTASGSFTVTTAGNYTFDCLNPGHPAMFNTVEFLPRPIPSEFCFDFTEINTTSCDPLMVSYQAQFNMASLADMSCDLDLQTMDATPEVVTVNVYPDVATLANAAVAGDGTCGPSLTQDCANFTVTNDYDANGANPDFSAETMSGNVVFTITNPAAPTACQTTTVPATFDCSVPGVTMDKNDADDSDDTQEVASGGTATFTITVTNSGTEDLCNVVVTDPNGLNCEMTYTDNGGTLAVGDTWTYTCTQANVTAPFTNTATVNAEGCTSGTMVDDMDDSDVTVAPEITIVKDDADNTDDTQEVANGGTATFTITVTNSGTEDLCNVSVTDPNGLSCEMTYTDNGGTLAVGDTWTYTCTQTNVTAAFTNTATVNGEGCTSGTLVDDEDDSEVTLEATVPSITMDKDDADDTNDTQEVASGGTATFTITVTNNGTEDLCNVNVTDPNGLNCEMTYTDNGGTLVVGDTWTYTCTQADVTMPFANTATVNAEGCTSGTAVNDTDVSDVTVAPEITIVKDDADNTDDTQEVPNDGTATFTITVTNNGTEDLCNVVVTDPNGLNCEMTYTDNGGTLAIGDTWTYTCTQTNVTTAFTNTATVNAEGCTSGTTATDEDDSDVTLEPEVPSVTMDKNDADNGDDTQEVASGGTATFTITVTNNGTEDLCNVSVTDPNGLNCEMTYTDNGGTLAVGDTWTYTCTQTVTAAFTNTATVNAEGCTSGTSVDDMDDSDVTLPPEVPSVTIDKDDADNTDDTQMVVGGGTATFTITVTNNGTEDLCNVMITDPNSSGCVMTYTDNGGTLAVGDTWTYTCTQENVTDAFINTAVVSAEGCTSGTMVNDMDDSEVIVDQPSVSMDKNDGDNGDDTQQVEVDGTATFTITVTNNGMEDLCNVSVVDPDGASCEMTYTDNGGVLAIGDTWTYTCTVENVLMSFVNAATVNAEGCTSGTPVDDTDVSPVIVPSPPSIPTVGQWGLIILGLMMSIVAIIGIRQRAIEESTT